MNDEYEENDKHDLDVLDEEEDGIDECESENVVFMSDYVDQGPDWGMSSAGYWKTWITMKKL